MAKKYKIFVSSRIPKETDRFKDELKKERAKARECIESIDYEPLMGLYMPNLNRSKRSVWKK